MADDDGYKHLKLVQTEPRSTEKSSLIPNQEPEINASPALNSQQEIEPIDMQA